jgi:hypothetical protein
MRPSENEITTCTGPARRSVNAVKSRAGSTHPEPSPSAQ